MAEDDSTILSGYNRRFEIAHGAYTDEPHIAITAYQEEKEDLIKTNLNNAKDTKNFVSSTGKMKPQESQTKNRCSNKNSDTLIVAKIEGFSRKVKATECPVPVPTNTKVVTENKDSPLPVPQMYLLGAKIPEQFHPHTTTGNRDKSTISPANYQIGGQPCKSSPKKTGVPQMCGSACQALDTGDTEINDSHKQIPPSTPDYVSDSDSDSQNVISISETSTSSSESEFSDDIPPCTLLQGHTPPGRWHVYTAVFNENHSRIAVDGVVENTSSHTTNEKNSCRRNVDEDFQSGASHNIYPPLANSQIFAQNILQKKLEASGQAGCGYGNFDGLTLGTDHIQVLVIQP